MILTPVLKVLLQTSQSIGWEGNQSFTAAPAATVCDHIPAAAPASDPGRNLPFGTLRSSAWMQGPEQSHLFPS